MEHGQHVEVLAENSMIDEVRATGAIFRPWVLANNRPARGPEHDPLQDWQCRTPAQLFTRLLDRLLAGPARQYAADVISAVDAHPPNRVVCSMFVVGAMVGAEAACIPYDVLMPNIYVLPARGLPPFGLGGQPPAGPLGRIRDLVVTKSVQRQWNKGLDRINEFRIPHRWRAATPC